MSSIVYHDWKSVQSSQPTLKLCSLCGAFNDEDNLKLACHSQHLRFPHNFVYSKAKPRDPYCRVCLHHKSDCALNCKDSSTGLENESSSSSQRMNSKQNVDIMRGYISKNDGTLGIPKKKSKLSSSSSSLNSDMSGMKREPSEVEDESSNSVDSDDSIIRTKYRGKNQAIKRRKGSVKETRSVKATNAAKTKTSIDVDKPKYGKQRKSMMDEELNFIQKKIEEEKRRIEAKDRREKEEVQRKLEQVKLREQRKELEQQQKKELEQQRRKIAARALIDRESKKRELEELKRMRTKDEQEDPDIWFNGKWLTLMEPLINDFHGNNFSLVSILQGAKNKEFR